MTAIDTLIGRTVIGILVNDDQSMMVFETRTGDVILGAAGDCCSESWFADLLGVDALLNQKVESVEEVPLPDYDVWDGRGRQEEDVVYGYRLTTLRGYADLIFRNSSNGFYGGSLYTTEQRPDRLTPIISDWHA